MKIYLMFFLMVLCLSVFASEINFNDLKISPEKIGLIAMMGIEYFIGKTKFFHANSSIDLILDIGKFIITKSFKKTWRF